ncbi:hypothetical protein [Paeniglutamicibacter sp. Y32M11]|jgi:hypothetical protein|uniref:hypothetical protein n=1 Tax=Paeniglutamicibacter sp. Y32M11 TaxID=2853258 RepID=UPI001046C13B|nr:hypothetical protein [Paeniglutamicibacter sp. Y32M11]QXQ10797.1 hypothetical protein KUF55_02350 [Paeniglutamicibacter sp. Y32M11]
MLKWFGLSGEHPEGTVPMWSGVSLRIRVVAGALWLVLAAGIFALLHFRLPESDGFGGFLPIFVAIIVFSAGTSTTERSLLRTRSSARQI